MKTEISKHTASGDEKPLRFLRRPEVLARIGVSWITLDRWEQAGLFPKRCHLGPNTVAWSEAEGDQWCATKIATAEQKEFV